MKMKRIFCMAIMAMAVASCCKDGNSMYFDNSDKRITNEPTAEFDTLSYAVGMNLGLSIRFQPSGITFNHEALFTAFDAELAKEQIDYDFLAENSELLQRFSQERLQPYTMSQFRKKIAKQDTPNLTIGTLNLFNSEFTEERVSEIFGHDMAGFILKSAYPLNMYWTRQAMSEALALETEIIHDTLLRLTMPQMRTTIQKYNTQELPKYFAKASYDWLKEVSKKRGVEAMAIDNDTLYYRIDIKGNNEKPRGMNDTIALSYDLYTRSGKLIESLAKREAQLREAVERAEIELADSITRSKSDRIKELQQLKEQLRNTENLRIPVSKALLKGMQYAVQNIGEGGKITVWMPASLAFGERGNRMVSPNDAVVMSIELKEVSYGPTEEELAAKQGKKILKGKAPLPPKEKVLKMDKPERPEAQKVVIQPVDKK